MQRLLRLSLIILLALIMLTGYGGLCGQNDKDTSGGSGTSANNPPVLAAIGNKTVNEGQTLGFTVSATDPDGDALTYSLTGLPAGYTLNAATGVFSWTPSFIQSDSYTVIFTVTDTKGATDDETITITVQNVPPPAQVSSPDPANEATDTPITQQLSWASATGATSYDVYFSAEGGSASGGGIPLFAGNTVTNTYSLTSLNYNTTYYWRIDSKNTARNTQGVVWSFTTAAPTLPPQVTSPDPANGATGVPITQQLNWAVASGATSYQIQVATDSNFTNIVTSSVIASVSVAIPSLQYSTTYYWRIDSKNTAGTTQGVVWSFTTAAPTPPPQVSSPDPANGATDVPITTTQLSWFSASGATSYQIQVATDSNFTNIVTSSVIASVSVAIPSLQYSTTYYWRIDSKNTAGTTTGLVWSFTTAAPTLPPQVSSPIPANGTTGVPITQQLSWAVASGATLYQIQVATDSNFTNIVTSSVIASVSVAIPSLQYSTAYYWRIDSKNTAGTTQGVVWSFTTAAPTLPPQVTTPDPANGATDLPITQQLSWAVASGAASYDVYFAATTTGWTPITNTVLSSYALSPLLYATTYYWRIDSKNYTGTTQGLVWSFTTAAPTLPPAQVTSPDPANGAAGVSVTQQLSWAVASGAASYDVYFGATNPPPLIGNQTGVTYNPGTLAYNALYYRRIDSKNSTGTTTGMVWPFTTQVTPSFPPAQVTTPTPANGATGVPVTPQLSWAPASGAASYDVHFSAIIANSTVTTYTPAGLTPDTTYNWRIDSKNSAGNTQGLDWSFTTSPLPALVTSPNPANGAANVITTTQLSWAAVSGVTSYDVYFGTSATPPFINNQTTTSYVLAVLSCRTTYYWRIDPKNVGGTSAGTVWSFTTVPLPPGPVTAPILPPDGASGISILTQLQWSAPTSFPAYAESYDVYFGTSDQFVIPVQTGIQTSYNPGILLADTVYYWRIDTKNFTATTPGTVYSFTAVNFAPILTAIGDKTVTETALLTFSISAIDPEGYPITYSATGLPGGAAFDTDTQTFSWTTGYSDAGVYPDVKFRATDIGGVYAEETIAITVNNVDRPPVLTSVGNKSVNETSLLAFSLAASDPDLDIIAYSMVFTPTGATLDPITGNFSWTTGYSDAGVYPCTFTATSSSLSDFEAITITVTNVDRPPVLTSPGDKTVIRGQLLAFSLAAADPDLDTIVYSRVFTPTGETLNPSTGAFAWTPSVSYAGTYPATFTATANSLSSEKTISITVNAFGAPAQLTWVTPQPQPTTVSATMPAFAVRVQDQFGNYVPAVTVAITATDNTRIVYQAGARVTTYAQANSDANGLATFSAISMTQAGAGYRFRASSGALTPVNSDAFNIIPDFSLSNPGGGNWAYNRPITVTNNSGATLTDYQVLLEPFRDSGDFSGDNLNNSNLVGCWNMSEGQGTTTADASGSGNTGTLVNSPTWTTGRYGNGLQFNNAGSTYVNVADSASLDLLTDISIEVWINVNSLANNLGIVTKGDNGYSFLVYTTGKLSWGKNTVDEIQSVQTLTTGRWYHIVATRTGGSNYLYIDGKLDNSAAKANFNNTADALLIGSNRLLANWYFNGLIDEVKIYNRALSAEEISTRYGSGLVGSWHFSEGTGTVATDSTDYRNNGTLVNGPTWTTGRFGNALAFDGTDDYVSLSPDIPAIKSNLNWTVEFWYKTSDTGSGTTYQIKGACLSKGDSVVQHLHFGVQTGKLTFEWWNGGTGSISDSAVSADGNWHHGVFVGSSAGTVSVYVDGNFKTSGAYNHTVTSVQTRFGGNYQGTAGYNFNGLIDEARVYNRALSASEIALRYNNNAPKVRHDFADVRFTNSDATQEYNYWQETDSRFWVKIPSLPISQSAIRIYYGNVSATASSSGPNTFDFFEDFEGYAVGGISGQGGWTQTGSGTTTDVSTNQSVSGAKSLRHWYNSGYSTAWKSIPAQTSAFVAEWSQRHAAANSGLCFGEGTLFNDYNGGWVTARNVTGQLLYYSDAGDANLLAYTLNKWYRIKTAINPVSQNIKVYVDDSGALYDGDMRGNVTSFTTINTLVYADVYDTYMDDIRIRRYSSVEPTAVLGNQTVINSENLSNSNNNPWSNYRTIAVNNSSAGELVDYQVLLEPFRDSGDFSGDNLNNTGLVGSWSFSEGTGGTTADASGSGNNGTLVNSPTWTTGRFGNALSFDGTDDYVNCGTSNLFNGDANFTIEAWVRTTYSAAGYAVLYSEGHSSINDYIYLLVYGSGGTVGFAINDGATMYNVTSTESVNDGIWHHLSGVRNGSTMYVYVDGVLNNSISVSPVSLSLDKRTIGALRRTATVEDPYQGQIDEVKVFNRALSAEEIATRYGSGLVGSWHFSEGTGTSVADMSGQGNNGTWNGSGSHWDAAGRFGSAGKFNGTDDYVNSGDINTIDSASQFTFSAWVKLNAMPADHGGIISKHTSATDGIMFGIYNTGFVEGYVRNGANTGVYSSAGDITTGQWYYLTMVYDGTQSTPSDRVKLYKNGQLLSVTTAGGNLPTTTSNNASSIITGCFPESGLPSSDDMINGVMDEICVYSRALSAPEITTRYNSGAPKVKHDLADVRFTNSDATQEYSYWQETDVKFWVKITSLATANNTIRLYYGNVSATNSSNTTIFNFFDDFDSYSTGALNSQGGWSGNANFDITNTDYHDGIKSARLPSGGIGDIISKSFPQQINNSYTATYWLKMTGVISLATVRFYEGTNLIAHAGFDNSAFYDNVGTLGGSVTSGQWYSMKLIIHSDTNTHDIYVNNGATLSIIGRANGNNIVSGINKIELISDGRWSTVWDTIRVRKYSAVEPASAPPGPEQ